MYGEGTDPFYVWLELESGSYSSAYFTCSDGDVLSSSLNGMLD